MSRWLTSTQCILGILGHGIGLVQDHQLEALPEGRDRRKKAFIMCTDKHWEHWFLEKNSRQIIGVTWRWSWCWQSSGWGLVPHQCLCRLTHWAINQNQTDFNIKSLSYIPKNQTLLTRSCEVPPTPSNWTPSPCTAAWHRRGWWRFFLFQEGRRTGGGEACPHW